MADLPEALDAALRARYRMTEVRTPATQRRGLLARMNQLEKHYARKGDRPGQAARRAAQAAGISPDAWRRWRAGTQKPSAASLTKITNTHRDRITIPSLRRSTRAVGPPAEIHVSAVVRWGGYYNQTRYRTIKFGPGGIARVMSATIRAWALDGPQAAALALQQGLTEVSDNVANEPDGTPGILFEGDNVQIEWKDYR